MKYLIALLLITNISFSQEWEKTKLNKFSSIEFPNTPQKSVRNGDVYYSTSDEYGTYIVMIKDLKNEKVPESKLPQYYKGLISGTLNAQNSELINQNQFTINGVNGVNGNEMVYLDNSNPKSPNLRHKRFLILNASLISYEFWTYKEIEALASVNKNKFFKSISVVEQIENKTKKEETNTTFEMGFLVGKIVSYLLVISVIIGIILLLRNMSKKRNNSDRRNL